jgi:dUTP pyrophosphatase
VADLPGGLSAALTALEIRQLLAGDPPLASGLEDADVQVQPNGLDVRLGSVWLPRQAGRLGRVERLIPERGEQPFDARGWLHLPLGAYVVRLCETVHLPPDVMALGFARSSLLRAGCGIFNAVWDAGYHGRSEVLLVIMNPAGLTIERGARIAQLVFFRLAGPTHAYRGVYQGENEAGQ